jgi:thiol-disulfide isomerase/thioredoxin
MTPIRQGLFAGAMLLAGSLHAQTLKISGEIKGLDRDVYIYSSNRKVDTIKVTDGRFSGTIAVKATPERRSVMIGRFGFGTWIEAGELKVVGDTGNIKSFALTGTPTQDDFRDFNKQWDEVSAQLQSKYAGRKDTGKAFQNAVMSEYSVARTKLTEDFIRKHPDSYFSMHLLTEMRNDHQQQMALYSILSPGIQQSSIGEDFRKKLDVSKRSAVGAKIIDFTRNDQEGKPVSIAAYRGKYVLIDFWASWCGPCRMENPNVLEAYNKYKDHNFTVLGVTIDDDTDKWKQAVKEDGMPWVQIRDRENRKSELADYYGFNAIPSSLLIAPDGTILARNLRGVELHNKLAELIKL